jgi:hypothetical protein
MTLVNQCQSQKHKENFKGHCVKFKGMVAQKQLSVLIEMGAVQLACGSQAYKATLLFDRSMSALSLLPASNSAKAL